jgi:membrane protein
MAGDGGAALERLGERARRLWGGTTEAVTRAFDGESIRLRAMALTYLSIFAVVPALVVVFSVVQAVTGMERISAELHAFILDNLAVGAQNSLEPYLTRFTSNAHAASAGLVGAAFLAWSAISLFSNVERAINDLWGIRRRRPLARQVVISWVGLTLGPLLLAGSMLLGLGARAWLAGTGLGSLAAAGSVLLTCALFSVVYWLAPYTRVRPGAAVSAGLVAGLVWEVAKWGYAAAVTRFFGYSAIYGSVAVLPTFLLWLFVSWTILLAGARIAYVVQFAPALWRGGLLANHPATREALAGEVLLAVALAHRRPGGLAPDEETLARSLGKIHEDVAEVVEALRSAELLRPLEGGGLVPGRPADRITLLDIRRAVIGPPPGRAGGALEVVERTLAGVEDASARQLQGTTLQQLCDTVEARRETPGAGGTPQPG